MDKMTESEMTEAIEELTAFCKRRGLPVLVAVMFKPGQPPRRVRVRATATEDEAQLMLTALRESIAERCPAAKE